MDKEAKLFELNKGWVWIKLSDITLPITRTNKTFEDPHGEFKYIDIEAIDNNSQTIKKVKTYTWENAPSRAQQIVEIDDILFATVRPYLKNIAIVTNQHNKSIASSGFCILRTFIVNPKYVYYYILTQHFIDSINLFAKGTSYPAVTNKIILEQKIPLAPLNEQDQIVEKIETFFSELYQSEKGLKNAKQQLGIYKQALLKSAFEGKLTNKDIKAGKLPIGWKMIKIEKISNVVRGGSPRPAGDPKYYDGNIPFLKVKDITKDEKVYLKTFEYTIKEAGLKKTRRIAPRTLLLSNSGATLGIPKICMINATINDGIAAFLDLDDRSIYYLYYYLLLNTQKLRNIDIGATQPNLNTSIIKNIEIPYCSFEEQKYIVEILESRFTLIENLEESISKTLYNIKVFRNSILKKAFEGKLVNKNSIDESASKLIQRIEKEKGDYLKTRLELEKLKPKIKRQMETKKTVLEILKESKNPISAQKLWENSVYEGDIEGFYSEIKEIYSELIEVKEEMESLLSLRK